MTEDQVEAAEKEIQKLTDLYVAKIDLHVATNRKTDDSIELSPADKVALIGLLNVDVSMPRGVMSVLASVEQAAESLARLYDGGSELVLNGCSDQPVRRGLVP